MSFITGIYLNFSEFNQGLGPLLSTRGQQMVSRSSDDNFLLDDKESCNYEVFFSSCNYVALHLRRCPFVASCLL